MGLVVLGLFLVLTYLLLRGAAPDAALHERRLRAIDALILNQAALHRDVLRASHGLLLNYDPLVATVTRLREVAEELRGAGAASGPLMDSIIAELDEQEALVEDFKSAHALLQNSLTYFGHLSHGLSTPTSEAAEPVATAVGRLANRMFRFVGGSSDDVEGAEVAALLDQLSILAAPAALRQDIDVLRAHGGLILKTLPTVDGILEHLLATRISEQARALQDLFIEDHGRAETLAWRFRVLLYLASVLLLVYLSHLYVRLRANARTLKGRSDFEHLIAGISAQLIDTPLDRTGDVVKQGLEQLGRHTGVDRAYLLFRGADDAMGAGSHSWRREGIDASGGWPDGALAIGSTWRFRAYERHGCIDVPSVQALPGSEEKSRLTEGGIRSWLCVPVWYAGNRVGLLGFDAVEAEKRWVDDDIALLRTIGEILASALGREQAEREKQTLELQLRHAQRIEALGTLAGGIAHDLNNVLAPIMLGMGILKDRLTDDDSREVLATISSSAKRGAEMVAQVLSFARGQEGRRVEIRVANLVADVVRIAKDTFPKSVEIVTQVAPDTPAIIGDPTQCHQVLLNLCVNARDAMPDGGTLTITARLATFDAQGDAIPEQPVPGGYVVIQVHDTGVGIPPHLLDKIFDPFFTTKESGKGTGLGLSTSLAIVRNHGGVIRARSHPNTRGSTFEIYLPAASAAAAAVKSGQTHTAPRGAGQTILVVDDEPSVRLVLRTALERAGYEVLPATNGREAVDLFRAQPAGSVGAVIIDMMMPVMGGLSAIQELVKINPNVRIIAASGIPDNEQSAKAAGRQVRQFLAKPFSTDKLLRVVGQVMNS
jgi:signal transduction histidine kinase/ActR/RegA family two-component response regulator